MNKIRIGKDIVIKWAILTNGQKEDLKGRDLKLLLYPPIGQTIELNISVSDNIISSTYKGVNQKYLGIYRLTLWENFGKDNQTAVDKCNIFQLVKTTCEENLSNNGLSISVINLSTDTEIDLYYEKVKDTNEIKI